MPWYKSGTVSVVLNSNAVIGAGTAFIANSRVGDAFRGPDGGWYEVTNIASDTAMSISPNYQGATNAAGTYALAPMQGYVKDSADALRALVNTYGAKLAALGTTGNYDVLPVLKGGTGRTTIGTSIANDVTTSSTDTTAGRLLKVGDYGLGTPIILTNPDLNTVITGKEYYVTGATNGPAANGWLSVLPLFSTACAQRFVNESGGAISERFFLGSVWSLWKPVVLGGANSTITSLSGLTTALSVAQGGTGVTSIAALLTALIAAGAYSKSNAIGTVSDSGGVPSGAIIESGLINGCYYTKFADGSLINRRKATIGGGITTPVGSVFKGLNLDFLNFAVPFVGDYEAFGFAISSGAGGGWAGQQVYGSTGSSWGSWAAYSPTSVAGNVDLAVVAFGRWKA